MHPILYVATKYGGASARRHTSFLHYLRSSGANAAASGVTAAVLYFLEESTDINHSGAESWNLGIDLKGRFAALAAKIIDLSQ